LCIMGTGLIHTIMSTPVVKIFNIIDINFDLLLYLYNFCVILSPSGWQSFAETCRRVYVFR